MSAKTKQLVFSAAAIALATVISVVIKLPSLPNGGSVTLFSMLVITLIGYWYGPATGFSPHSPMVSYSLSQAPTWYIPFRYFWIIRWHSVLWDFPASFPKRKTDCSSAILWVSSADLPAMKFPV